jgi:hypothetical protein
MTDRDINGQRYQRAEISTGRDINGQRYQRAANGPAEQDEETA